MSIHLIGTPKASEGFAKMQDETGLVMKGDAGELVFPDDERRDPSGLMLMMHEMNKELMSLGRSPFSEEL